MAETDRVLSPLSTRLKVFRFHWSEIHEKDKTIDFDTDQFLTAPVSTIQSSLPQLGLVRNGDMEIPVDSVFFSVATGEGHGSPHRN